MADQPHNPQFVAPPKPEVPPPDFAEIGKQVGVGAAGSGWIESFWHGATSWLTEGAAAILTWLLSIAKDLAIYIAKIIIKAENESDDAFAELAAIAVEDLFGISVDQAAFKGRGGRAARTGVAGAIGNSIIESLFGDFRGGGESSIQPSSVAAERYLGTITQLALEGWLEGWIAEALSAGQLETFAELDDIMAQVLGLGRLSRRVMGPPLTMLVVDPFEQLLQETYRPRLLAPGEAIRQYLRGKWTYEQLSRELGRQGYSDERILALVRNQERGLSPGDVAAMVRRGRWTRAEAIEYLRGQGYPERTAEAELQLVVDARREQLNASIISDAVTAFIARDITRAQLQAALEKTTLPADEVPITIAAAEVRQELRTRSLSLGQAEEAYKRGLISLTDFRRMLESMGYSARDSTTLELLLLSEIRDAEDARRRRDDLEKERAAKDDERRRRDEERREEARRRAADRGLSLAQAEEAVRDGILTWGDYRALLARHGYSAPDVQVIVDLLEDEIADEEERARIRAEAEEEREEDRRRREEERREEKERRDREREEERKRREEERRRREEELERRAAASALTIAQAEESVVRGIRTVAWFRDYLVRRQIAGEDVDILVTSLELEIRDRKEKEDERKQEEARQAGERATAKAERERRERERVAADLERKRKADAAAVARRAEIEAELATRRVSLGKSEELVKEEIWTIEDYESFLRGEGYIEGDVTALVILLKRKIAEAAEVEAERRRRLLEQAKRKDLAG